MALLTVQTITVDGIEPTFVAADAGLTDTFSNAGQELAEVINGGGSPITVTPTVTGSLSTGEQILNPIVTIPAGETRKIGPFNARLYSAIVSLVYSDVTTVTVGIFKLPRTQQPVVSG